MKLTLQSTSQIVELNSQDGCVPGRVWHGRTENGIECWAIITRIVVREGDDNAQFQQELQAVPAGLPSPEQLQAIPARMIL